MGGDVDLLNTHDAEADNGVDRVLGAVGHGAGFSEATKLVGGVTAQGGGESGEISHGVSLIVLTVV